jgi:hypothetical protein
VKHRIVVTRHRPWIKAGFIAGGAFLLAMLAWGLYSYTRATTVSDFERAQTELEKLREERRLLTRDLRLARTEADDLRNQLAYAKRSVEIDTQACEEVSLALNALQSEASSLREQLAFYRGIAAPGRPPAGVRVYDLKLEPAGKGSYRFDLTLIQSVRQDGFSAGTARIDIHGTQAGAARVLTLADIGVGDAKKLVFSMKYYEEFRGELRIPEGFRPLRAVVTLELEGGSTTRTEETFEWSRILAGGGGSENVRQQQP